MKVFGKAMRVMGRVVSGLAVAGGLGAGLATTASAWDCGPNPPCFSNNSFDGRCMRASTSCTYCSCSTYGASCSTIITSSSYGSGC